MSKSEAVVIESIEVRELLRFLFYLDILNKLSLLQRKHSKYMYARCLNFPCFINYLAACMHACILHVLSVRLSRVRTNSSFSILLDESYLLAQWYTANHNRSKCFVSVISEFLFESTDSYQIPYLYM